MVTDTFFSELEKAGKDLSFSRGELETILKSHSSRSQSEIGKNVFPAVCIVGLLWGATAAKTDASHSTKSGSYELVDLLGKGSIRFGPF